ncbi:MAG: hypothetical protein CMJ19_22510 [Phycisphaeraceae bacterium]|nr:hypothetical protein [Phycisphaeraceae bacterium]
MTRTRLTQILAVVFSIVCMVGAGILVPRINNERTDLQVETGLELGEGLPPQIVLATTALGTFRGLFVDILWHRANKLKEEGKFQEASTLSQWITTLQPRFPQVWAFHAWNMAYNISVATHTSEERWDWVNKGIRLLREQGIPYNPRAVRLYRELSWIFFHKIGQYSDDAHWFYKRELAYEMQQVLGDLDRGGTTEQVITRFKAIADAPDTVEQLVELHPNVQPVLDALKELGYEPNERLLRQLGTYIMSFQSLDSRIIQGAEQSRQIPSGVDPRLVELIFYNTDKKWNAALPHLVNYLRKHVIVARYHMQPQKMLEMMEEFGPIDWRHPAAHGMYWAKLGTEQAASLRNNDDVDIVNTYRQNVHSMQLLTRSGRLSFDPFTRRLQMLPDVRFIPAYEKAVEEADEAYFEKYGKHSDSYKAGHENFLLAAVVYNYLYGDIDQAAQYFKKVRELYGNEPHNHRSQRYTSTLQDLVIFELQGNATMMDRSTQFIDAMIRQGLEQGLAHGRMDTFNRCLALAQQMHTKFNSRGITTNISPQDRMKILDWPQTLFNSYISYMKQESVDPLIRTRIWMNTPLQLKQQTYDQLLPVMTEQMQRYGLDVNRAFAAPEGMENIRAKDAQQNQQKKTDTKVEMQ